MAEAEIKAPAQAETETKAPATPERGAPRHPLLSLRDEMDRLFDDFLGGFSMTPSRRRFEPEPWRRVQRLFEAGMPAVDVTENDQEYTITAELPGMEEKDIEIALAGEVLTVKGEKKQEREEKKENYVLSERRYGAFERSFPLPQDADPERIEARFKSGVLSLTLPKKPEAQAKRRKIEVKAS
jgi:HSP20 family protein